MKATKVDKDLCIGCGLCCGICDEVFRMNEQGKAEAYQPANAENQGAVQEAIDSCPVSAIAWEGYLLNPKEFEVTLAYKDQTTEIVYGD